jgi:hypothetical protein
LPCRQVSVTMQFETPNDSFWFQAPGKCLLKISGKYNIFKFFKVIFKLLDRRNKEIKKDFQICVYAMQPVKTLLGTLGDGCLILRYENVLIISFFFLDEFFIAKFLHMKLFHYSCCILMFYNFLSFPTEWNS